MTLPPINLGQWHKPADLPAWVALAFAGYLAFRTIVPWTERAFPRARFLTIAGFAAAFLSLGYIAHYLRGGPRIIDATSYFLQGRALSHGAFSWSVPEVSASFRGRFLLFHEPDRIAGIFPPGYPLLLAAGFLFGAPMVIGPALAAANAIATYALARELARGHAEEERIARLAAALSVVCAALRYHTADTMSHGASALAITVALASALAARRHEAGQTRLFMFAGFAVGYVACTRTASALAIGLAVFAVAFSAARRARVLACTALATIPGFLLLLAANRAATGSAFQPAQISYYAASDGPPGCFRYGFGKDIGCVFEHGDFVKARLNSGYGVIEALGTSLRRLRMHAMDVANFEPLALLLLFAARFRTRPVAIALAVVVGQAIAYSPFYFDGNYPGGGARLLADILPIEHGLIAFALAHILPRIDFARRAFAVLALATLGFAIHASHDHRALADRDGGRPMFEPDKLREANVLHGLVFFDTDHGFSLAHDPGMLPSHGVVAARLRGDDHDRLLHARLGHPIANVYRLTPEGPTVTRFAATGSLTDPLWKFEAESDWPPIEQTGGWAEPIWVPTGRVLAVKRGPAAASATVVLELPVPRAGVWRVRPTIVHRGSGAEGTIVLYQAKDRPLATWTYKDGTLNVSDRLPEQAAELSPPHAYLSLTTNEEISMDYVSIEAGESSH